MSNPGLYLGVIALMFGLSAAVVLMGGGRAERQAVSRSLAVVGRMELGRLTPVEQTSFKDRIAMPALMRLSNAGRRISPAGTADRLQRRLDLAGNPSGWDVERVLGAKGFGLLAAGVVGFWLGHSEGLLPAALWTASAGAAGFYLPDVVVYNAGTKRQAVILNTLADALDLLTISVEAGLGFDAAIAQVARNTEGPLAGEFFRLLQEVQIGKTRADAFRAMSDRTEVQELKGFSSSIIQADTLGIPIANVLREQAKEMRLKRMQRAEERAMKVPVKILFPTVLFILPALFVVIIGPGAIAILKLFGG